MPDPYLGPYADPFEARLASMSREFQDIARRTRAMEDTRNGFLDAQTSINRQGATYEERKQAFIAAGQATEGTIDKFMESLTGSQSDAAYTALGGRANAMWTSMQAQFDQMAGMGPDAVLALGELFKGSLADSSRRKYVADILGLGGGAVQAPTYTFHLMPNGDYMLNGSNGTSQFVGYHPEWLDKQVQTVKNARTGETIAKVFDSQGNIVSETPLGVLDFPGIDPAEKFRLEKLSAAANVEQSMASLDLTQRSMMIKAIGDDLANQVALGRMVYDEAQLNLNRLNTAFTQRRDERAQMLHYAVTKSSLRTNAAGEQVTQLPFSSQLAGILTAATGRQFSESDFQLGTTTINPDQTAQDIMAGSAYTSPIPGLSASMTQARTLMEGILGKAAGSQAASKQLIAAAMPPQTQGA